MSVQIVIADSDAHPCLLHAIVTQSRAAQHSFLAKGPVMIVHKKKTGSGIACDVYILPAVFVKVRRNNRHAISGRGLRYAGLLSYICKGSIAVVSIERVLTGLQPTRPALDGNSLPAAVRVFAGRQGIFKRKANVVGNEKVQVSIAVVINERAAGAKPWLIVPEPGRFGYVCESAVAVVAVKRVLPEICEENIVKSVVVVVSDANSGGP